MLNGTVGSNPTLSAIFRRSTQEAIRGAPAKGLGWVTPVRGFESLLLRQCEDLFKRSFFIVKISNYKKMSRFLVVYSLFLYL